jgi:hypothetical protein
MSRKRIPSPIDIPFELPDDLPVMHDNQELVLEVPEATKASSKGVGAVVVHHVVTFLQVVMVLGLGAWSYVTYKNTDAFVAPRAGERNALEPYVVESQLQRIEAALRVYEALNEKYPVTLDVLVDEGLLLPSDVAYPSRVAYRYQRFGEGFKLEAPRLNSAPASADDAIIFDESP